MNEVSPSTSTWRSPPWDTPYSRQPLGPAQPSRTGEALPVERSIQATSSGSRSSLSDSASENARALADSKREPEAPSNWEALRVFMVYSLRIFRGASLAAKWPGIPSAQNPLVD